MSKTLNEIYYKIYGERLPGHEQEIDFSAQRNLVAEQEDLQRSSKKHPVGTYVPPALARARLRKRVVQ
jgi:hypothetical protein